MKDLKIKIQIGDQPIMVWEILYKEEKYTKFKASISAGKKQADGTWINKSQNFNCFVFGEVKARFDREVQPQKRIKVWGNISMLPEKVQNPLNNFQTTLFSKAQINVDNFEIIQQEIQAPEQKTNNYFKTSKGF
jgi:transposase